MDGNRRARVGVSGRFSMEVLTKGRIRNSDIGRVADPEGASEWNDGNRCKYGSDSRVFRRFMASFLRNLPDGGSSGVAENCGRRLPAVPFVHQHPSYKSPPDTNTCRLDKIAGKDCFRVGFMEVSGRLIVHLPKPDSINNGVTFANPSQCPAIQGSSISVPCRNPESNHSPENFPETLPQPKPQNRQLWAYPFDNRQKSEVIS